MKKPFFSPPKQLLARMLVTFCAGFGCSYPVAQSFGLVVSARLLLCVCFGCTLLLTLADCVPRLLTPVYALFVAAAAALIARYIFLMGDIGTALTLFMNHQPLALAAYSRGFCALLALFFTIVGSFLVPGEMQFFISAMLCGSCLFLSAVTGADPGPLGYAPMIAALLLSCGSESVSSPRLLAATAIVLSLCLALAPISGMTLPPLSAFAARVQKTITDVFFFTQPRTPFSFSQTGWQPHGPERLGGEASPTDDAVMEVLVSERTLLRGSIRNEYTGLAWADTTSGQRFLLIDARLGSMRRNLFDQNRPSAAALDAIAPLRPIRIDLKAPASSTLFLTQRFRAPAVEDAVVYFSPSSEVFATRSLSAHDQYAFLGRALSSSTRGVREAVVQAADRRDDYAQTVRSVYLALPTSVEPEAYALAERITAAAETDYDKAAALCGYLQSHYAYTLRQSEPPLTRDFVCWFLFDEQKGYCTSFASAMVVLCRAIGLPARYIEGYAASPDADGIARVTQQNAHAWAEVYFPGFGWLSFDPTPGEGDAQEGDSSSDAANPTPSPTPTPTPSPTPSPSPSPTPKHDDPSVTTTPKITPAPEATSTPTPPPPDEPEKPEKPSKSSGFMILLLSLLLAALCALRLLIVSPTYRAQKAKSANAALLVWYAAAVEALVALRIAPIPGEAPASFLERAEAQLGGNPRLSHLGKAICISSFSRHRLGVSYVQNAQKVYAALLARLGLPGRLRLYARRFLRGPYRP